MIVELTNPSAFHALRIYSQDRARNVFGVPTAKAPMPKRETRAELETRGAAITMVPTRVAVREGGALRSVMRGVPTPLWRAEGAESLVEWITTIQEQAADDARRGPSSDAPKAQRVVDTWTEPRPFESVPPHGKLTLALVEEKRFLVECDEEVPLQIANQSNARTIRLRTRDSATGETIHAAWIAPAREYPKAAIVTANKKVAAVIELQPS
jgi:erythromycin esterase-like protein